MHPGETIAKQKKGGGKEIDFYYLYDHKNKACLPKWAEMCCVKMCKTVRRKCVPLWSGT